MQPRNHYGQLDIIQLGQTNLKYMMILYESKHDGLLVWIFILVILVALLKWCEHRLVIFGQ